MTLVASQAAKLARALGVRKIVAFEALAASDLAGFYPEFLYIGLGGPPAILTYARATYRHGIFWEYAPEGETPTPVYLGDALPVCEIDHYANPERVLQKLGVAAGIVVVSAKSPEDLLALVGPLLPGFTFTVAAHPGHTVLSGRRVAA